MKIYKFLNGDTEAVQVIVSSKTTIRKFNALEGWLVAEKMQCNSENGDCTIGYKFLFPIYLADIRTTDGEPYEVLAAWSIDEQREHYIDFDTIAQTRFRLFNYKLEKELGMDFNEMAPPLFDYVDKVLFSDSEIRTNMAYINPKGVAEYINGNKQNKQMLDFVKFKKDEPEEIEEMEMEEDEEENEGED
jgi:hypothetical protein